LQKPPITLYVRPGIDGALAVSAAGVMPTRTCRTAILMRQLEQWLFLMKPQTEEPNAPVGPASRCFQEYLNAYHRGWGSIFDRKMIARHWRWKNTHLIQH
jgi:hypothetical protein